jgi:tRNA dimethylallyltransferase
LSDSCLSTASLVVVAGPTACGKSELAVVLAERFGAEIVGADSRQLYLEMDAATAKPSAGQRARVPHHLVDCARVDDPWDTVRWCQAARVAIDGIAARGRRVILCGGTGLYLRSLLVGIFQGPGADAEVRRRLTEQEQARPGSLFERLLACDPDAARRIHANDLVRIVRALEVFEISGRTITAWQREQAAQADGRGGPRALVLVPRVEASAHRRAIGERARAMAQAGLVEEVRGLRERYGADVRPLDAIGYREAGAVLDGRLAAADLVPAIETATRRYAKRQRTWLRGQLPHREIADADDAVDAVAPWWG